MRFINVTIPKGATIVTANLIFTCNLGQSGATLKTRVTAEDVDDAPTFANDAAAFMARYANHTDAVVDWDSIPAWDAEESGADTTSPEIKTVIKEIIDRAGWTSGNDLVIFWTDFDDRSSDNAYRVPYSYEGAAAKAPTLHIEYTVPQTLSPSSIIQPVSYGTPTVATAALIIYPSSIVQAISIGTPTVQGGTPPPQTLLPSSIIQAITYGTPWVRLRRLLAPTRVANATRVLDATRIASRTREVEL
jgi:hypothetical protein